MRKYSSARLPCPQACIAHSNFECAAFATPLQFQLLVNRTIHLHSIALPFFQFFFHKEDADKELPAPVFCVGSDFYSTHFYRKRNKKKVTYKRTFTFFVPNTASAAQSKLATRLHLICVIIIQNLSHNTLHTFFSHYRCPKLSLTRFLKKSTRKRSRAFLRLCPEHHVT